jgi:predicted glycosyltransferase
VSTRLPETSAVVGPKRFIFYSHDGQGLGHLRRNLAIAAALTKAAPDASVLLATGCHELGSHGLAPNVDLLVLPALRKLGQGRYGGRRLPISGSDLAALRAGQLEMAVRSFRPDVMLVDKHPVGIRGELRPALAALSQVGGRAALGLRDILDAPGAVVEEWAASNVREAIEENFDEILVYGDPRVLDVAKEYRLPPSLGRRLSYCGYVVNPRSAQSSELESQPTFTTRPRRIPTVLATTGGGEDGRGLLECFIEAARDARWTAVAVSGPQLDAAERQALRPTAVDAGVELYGTVPEVASWFSHVEAVVCMGGYNTLGEAISRGTPTVCVPRVHPRQEQLIRARAFERLGLLRAVEPDVLNAALLRQEIQAVLGASRRELAARASARLDFGGARRAATRLLELAGGAHAGSERGQLRIAALPQR